MRVNARAHAAGDLNWCWPSQDDDALDALDALIEEETTLISAAGALTAQGGNLHSFPDATLTIAQQ